MGMQVSASCLAAMICDGTAGGGSVTFGAPMVLFSEQQSEMYKQLHKLKKAAAGRGRRHKLQWHNFVNNADAVPRFLGGSLNTVHQAIESFVPSMSVSNPDNMLR